MRYGLPYIGSKNAIAARLVVFLPPAEHFYDLFCGGCAVTHAAMLSGKYCFFHANDRRSEIPQLFLDCATGKRPAHDDWRAVSRDDFLASADPLIKQVWSFGNDGTDYLWGNDIEQIKLAAHRMLTADTLQERYNHYKRFNRFLYGDRCDLERLQSLERLQRLQSLQRL